MTRYPGAPPQPLWVAILNAAKTYHVPPLLLLGIWRIESGSNYPNPYVNSIGYGGLFGTKNWNDSTQNQANTAASILARLISTNKGDVHAALRAYSGGGYTTVPGYGGPYYVNPKTLFPGESGAADIPTVKIPSAIPAPSISGVTGAVGGAVSGVESVGKFLGKLGDPGFWLRVLEILGGAILVLYGLVLLARQVGLADSSSGGRGGPTVVPVPV